jgi:dienelactone hydrolase
MYGKGVRGSGPGENAKLMQPFMENRELLQSRMQAALDVLKSFPEVDPERTAAMGFCFGGLCVLDLARTGADVCGVISLHGFLTPPGNTAGRDIKAKLLVLHGNDDPMVPVESVTALGRELTEAGADWQIHVYGNARHAFTNPNAHDPVRGTVYDETADRRAWRTVGSFLEEVLAP